MPKYSPEAQAIRLLQRAIRTFEVLLGQKPTAAQLDDAVSQIIQSATGLRGMIGRKIIHYRSVCAELDYDGAACLTGEGDLTDKPCKVTCPKCRRDLDRPVEKPE
jgi:hypothetical protein